MALSFNDVITRLLEVGASDPVLSNAEAIAVVRDRRGIIRLAIAATQASEAERAALESGLTASLGSWYAGPALYGNDSSPHKKLALEILKKARDQWPASWPTQIIDVVRGTPLPLDLGRWGAVQRLLSKESWLSSGPTRSPWPLHTTTPTVVSFYSYKGGVGRSTLVAIVAAILAREGDTVAVIDLDLEAPGQQALFDMAPIRGVVDYVVEHIATGASSLDSLFIDVSAKVPDVKGRVHLASAGNVDWSYVEKIARLDFVAHTQIDSSPVHAALLSLLQATKRDLHPDWILLDARTGIHDLGGLAMHAFSHIDVLPARAGRQSLDGLRLCLEALARRRAPEDILTLLVHALAPAPLDDDLVSTPVQRKFRHDVYELFKQSIYTALEDAELPAEESNAAQHSPYPVPLDPTLVRLETLHSMADILDRPYYLAIVNRLRELATPPEDDGDE